MRILICDDDSNITKSLSQIITAYFHKRKIKCPYCGHEQKVQYAPDAICRGVFFKCQARHCKKEFEIKINQDK